MAITRTVTQVFNGPATAGAIVAPTRDLGTGLGVPAALAGTSSISPTNPASTIFGGDSVSNTAAYCGYRVVQSMNLSTNTYVTFAASINAMSRSSVQSWSNGGVRIVFEDGSGNWSAFNVYGSDLGPFLARADGGFEQFIDFGSNADSTNSSPSWFIDRNKTPVASSGTLNWATIAAFEIHFRPASSNRMQMVVGRFATLDLPIHTGTVSSALGVFQDVVAAMGAPGGTSWPFYWVGRVPSGLLQTVSPKLATTTVGLQIGNGSTTTTLTLASQLVSFWPRPEEDSATVDVPNGVILCQNNRLIDVFQSATDNVTFSNTTLTGLSLWGFRLRGTAGVFTASIVNFVRYAEFTAAHGSYTDCIWDGGTGAIEITTATTITRGIIRNGTNGIRITTGAGSYNGSIAFDNQSVYDIECGSGGAGTYNLPNISVVGGYTLKIRNNSATNFVTVAIPAGIAFSATHAGGGIAVSTPPTYQQVIISGFRDGSRIQIYDNSGTAPSGSRQLFNGTASSGSTVITGTYPNTVCTWTDTLPAVANRLIRVRIANVSGATAYNFIEGNIGTCGTGTSNNTVSYLVNQTLDTTYNSNAVVGSGVTGITFVDAGSNDLVNCNIAGGSVPWKDIYAAFVYWNFTATGIANDFTYISAPDTANYILSGMKVKNTGAGALSVIGGYGFDATTKASKDIIDTTGGSIFLAPDHVVAYQTTGTYAITGDISTVLTAVGNVPAQVLSAATAAPIAANVEQVNAITIKGTGTASDPWGP